MNTASSKVNIFEKANSALSRTANWIDKFGGRLAGSPACRATAEAIRADLSALGLSANVETFQTHPDAFTKFYRIDILLYAAGVVLLWLNQPLAAALVTSFMIFGAGQQFGYYREFYDRLYPLKTCQNVTATLEPQGEVRQQLIFSGHHDSAQELKFLKGNQRLYGLKILLPDATRMLAMVTAWCWVFWQLITGHAPIFMPYARILLVFGFLVVFSKFFLFSKEAVPGAGDNLIASSMLVDLAARFKAEGQSTCSTLEHTRLLFVSFDAEEAGLRGSRAWVKAHRQELTDLPTFALNIDSVYHLADLQFLTSDLNNHLKLDQDLAQKCIVIARRLGFPAKPALMKFGGGATDAAELARAGVKATTLIAMSTDLVRDGLVYHTMRDTVDAIEPEAVAACLSIANSLAHNLDQAS